jgi:hypothetical protein
MTPEEALDKVFEIRVANNNPWKKLMKLALRVAPREARDLCIEITENDLRVSHLMRELEKALDNEAIGNHAGERS